MSCQVKTSFLRSWKDGVGGERRRLGFLDKRLNSDFACFRVEFSVLYEMVILAK